MPAKKEFMMNLVRGLLDSPKSLHIWYTKKKDKVGDTFGPGVWTFGGLMCGSSRDMRIFTDWASSAVDRCQWHSAVSCAQP